MSEKIEINTLITKHENKCKGCRFEMVTVEDSLCEYGIPYKKVLQDNLTGKQYRAVSRLVVLLNELSDENRQLKEENEHFRKSRDKWKIKALRKDEQLKDCDNDCFNCRFYNKVCDFCTKFHIYTMTSDKDE